MYPTSLCPATIRVRVYGKEVGWVRHVPSFVNLTGSQVRPQLCPHQLDVTYKSSLFNRSTAMTQRPIEPPHYN